VLCNTSVKHLRFFREVPDFIWISIDTYPPRWCEPGTQSCTMHLIYVCGFETIPALSNTSKLKRPAKIMNSFTLCTLKSYGKRKIWRRLIQSWVAKTTSQWSLALNTAGMFKHDWLVLSQILATGCLNKLQGPTFWHVVYNLHALFLKLCAS